MSRPVPRVLIRTFVVGIVMLAAGVGFVVGHEVARAELRAVIERCDTPTSGRTQLQRPTR